MIEVIAGTNRPGSNTLKVARLVRELYADEGVDSQVLDLAELPEEIFSPASYKTKPAAFHPFQERVLQADGLHIVIPEYNGSFPGIMKYFIDMLKFPESFEHRAVTYTGLSAGANGNLRGVEQLQLIFGYRNAFNFPKRVWIPAIGKKLTADGGTLADEEIVSRLKRQVQGFAEFAELHKGMAVKTLA